MREFLNQKHKNSKHRDTHDCFEEEDSSPTHISWKSAFSGWPSSIFLLKFMYSVADI